MIRDFTMHDIDAVMKLWLDTNIMAHDFIKDSYWQDNFETVKEMMPNATIFVYAQNRIVQGFIGLMDDYIAGIFVCDELQSKGIGKQLLDHAKDKYDELSLHVYKRNNRAVCFYLREKFTISAEKIDENTGETEFVMNRRK